MKKSLLLISMLFAGTFSVFAQDKTGGSNGRVKAGFGLTVVQEQPEFPGGNDSLQSFLNRNLTYPEKAKADKVDGRVYVSFDVSPEGKIVGAKVISGVNSELDNEALRVVNLMPQWKPGTVSGKPVKVQYVFPIDFVLPKMK